MRIGVLGCGRWGTFLAHYLAGMHDVVLWGREDSAHLKTLIETGKNEYLTLRENVELTSDLGKALEPDVIVIPYYRAGSNLCFCFVNANGFIPYKNARIGTLAYVYKKF